MDTELLVENRIDDGQKYLTHLIEKQFDVTAACWVKTSEDGNWHLYIVSNSVSKGLAIAYREAYAVLQLEESFWVNISNVKLVHPDSATARDILQIQKRYSGRMPAHSQQSLLGGISTEEIYIYPSSTVQIPIYGLIFQGYPASAIHLSFEPHNPQNKLILQSGSGTNFNEYPGETGIDWLVEAPEGSKLERSKLGELLLEWNHKGNIVQSSSNEVLSFAKLGMHGFRLLQKPVT